jgi:tetratricopeptide (TPR) repeat protein
LISAALNISLTESEMIGDNMSMAESRENLIASALDALRSGDLRAADAALARLLAGLPDDPATHQVASVIALAKGDHVSARDHATISLRSRPQHIPTLLIAGRAARLSRDLAEADRHFTTALELDPRRAEAAFLVCVTRLERGDPSARQMLDHLIGKFPDDADGWFEIGLSLLRAEKLDAALSAFARAHRRADSHLRRGQILQQQQQPAAAIAAYETAVSLDDTLAEARFRLGVLYQDTGRQEHAIAAYRQALEQRPDLVEAEVNLGLLLQEANDLPAAYASYRRALRLRPESFGRIAQGLSASRHGAMWLDLEKLRQFLQA